LAGDPGAGRRDARVERSWRRRFQTWRATRARGPRIPAELWPAAIVVARVHGIHPTVAALKLNYYDLHRRLPSGAASQVGCVLVTVSAPVFVELAP